MKSIFRCVPCVLAAAILNAQTPGANPNGIILAGGGYRVPSPALDVAPGQVVVLHVHGVTANIDRILAVPDQSGLPHTLGGISVDLIQGRNATATSLELRAVYQTNCLAPCSRVTGITLQIPFELEMDPANLPSLRISENGKVIGGVLLRPVTDNVHVLNTCDDSQVFLSAAESVPQNVCASDVMHGQLLNSLYNLARGGDQASVWLYGMGATTERKTPCCNSPADIPQPLASFQLNFDFRPNAPAVPAQAGFGTTSPPIFAAYVGGGLYQVNFAVPPVPAGVPACDGVKIKSNLTVTVTGPISSDAAQICVVP